MRDVPRSRRNGGDADGEDDEDPIFQVAGGGEGLGCFAGCCHQGRERKDAGLQRQIDRRPDQRCDRLRPNSPEEVVGVGEDLQGHSAI